MKYELVVFDWDGTLLDSAGAIVRAIQSACRDLGLPIPDERRASHVIGLGLADAMRHVAGYCVVNDVSERAFQAERQGQWTKGKSCDNFGQTGPWLVTRDEIADPQALGMWLTVNGETQIGRAHV